MLLVLEYVTNKENAIHAHQTGLFNNSGENNTTSKLTNFDVLKIKLLLKNNSLKQYEIANLYGVSKECISAINRKRTWKHIEV